MSDLINRAGRVLAGQSRAVLAPLIRVGEALWLKGKRSRPVEPPIFIVGAPRTGSTILYQALTHACRVAYIDNTACAWHRNLLFGMWLSQQRHGDTPHQNFHAERGDTSRFGGHAPSECGGFWYRWLPRRRHFVDYCDINARMVRQLQAEVRGVSARRQQALLFKNLNAGQRLRLIQRAFPDARILFVRRDPRFVLRSILRARASAGVRPDQWWSIMPRNVAALSALPEAPRCAAQLYYLEHQIEQDLTLFPAAQTRIVHYQQLGPALIAELARWLALEVRPDSDLPAFQTDTLGHLEPAERQQLEQLLQPYPFARDLFL